MMNTTRALLTVVLTAFCVQVATATDVTTNVWNGTVWEPALTAGGGADTALRLNGTQGQAVSLSDANYTLNALVFGSQQTLSAAQLTFAANSSDGLPWIYNDTGSYRANNAWTSSVVVADIVASSDLYVGGSNVTITGGVSLPGHDVYVDMDASGTGSGAFQVLQMSGDAEYDYRDLRLRSGGFAFSDPAALGRGAVYLRNVKSSRSTKAYLCLMPQADMTITNDMYLPANDANQYTTPISEDRNLVFTGCLHGYESDNVAKKSCLSTDGSTLYVRGGLTSEYDFALRATKAAGSIHIQQVPVQLGRTLTVTRKGQVLFEVAGNEMTELALDASGTAVLAVENALPNTPALTFASSADGYHGFTTLMVKGVDAAFGSLTRSLKYVRAGLIIKNNDLAKCPTVSFDQTADGADLNVKTEGPFVFKKLGANCMTITNESFCVQHTLDVTAGTLALANVTGGDVGVLPLAATVILREGATLDLGGEMRTCARVEVLGGAVVNGTLVAETLDWQGAGDVSCIQANVTTISGSQWTGAGILAPCANGRLSVAADAALAVTNELALWFPFADATTLGRDKLGYITLSKNYTAACGTASPSPLGGGYLNLPKKSDNLKNTNSDWPASYPLGNEPYSFCMFVKVLDGTSTVNSDFWLRIGSTAADRQRLSFSYNGAATSILESWRGSSVQFPVNLPDGGTISNEWHALVTTYDGLNRKMYLDGTLIGEKQRTSLHNQTAGEFVFGGSKFQGAFDEVAVYKRALTAAEAASYATQGVTCPTLSAPNMTLAVASAASFRADAKLTVKALEGAGEITAIGLTVTDALTGLPTQVTGDLTLADGVEVAVGKADVGTQVVGTLTLAGSGAVAYTETPATRRTVVTLFAADAIVGDISTWTATAPAGYTAKLEKVDNTIRLRVKKSVGLAIIYR